MDSRQEALNKLKGVISKTPSKWHEKAKRRAEERPWKRRSQAVALAILRTLRDKKMSQKELAESIGVSPQQVNKWVKGNENFTFETIAKLEHALGIELIQVLVFDAKPKVKLELARVTSRKTKSISLNLGNDVDELLNKINEPSSIISTEKKSVEFKAVYESECWTTKKVSAENYAEA